MAIKNQIQALVQKEMDRKEFLKYGGGLLLAVIGVTGLLRVLLGSQEGIAGKSVSTTTTSTGAAEKAGGYGMSAYGR